MTLNQLDKLKSKWQKRLRIQDWDIEVRFVSLAEMLNMASSNTLGICECDNHKKKAWITVMREQDICKGEDDAETILVHELMHVVMPIQDLEIPHEPKDPVHVVYERIIDQMARAFREAYDGC